MIIPADRWYNSISVRRSRRQYDGRQISADVLSILQATCDNFRPFPGARAVLITQPPDNIFRGILGSYGMVKRAVCCVAFIGDMTDPEVQAKTGYTGEGIILEATALGLGTCWVGGFFRKDVAAKVSDVKTGERVLAITPVGFAVTNMTTEERLLFGRSHPRKSLSILTSGLPAATWPFWISQALEAARMAPSATNRQPWRFENEETRA